MTVSADMAMDSEGNLFRRLNDSTVMDLNTGELHIISGRPEENSR